MYAPGTNTPGGSLEVSEVSLGNGLGFVFLFFFGLHGSLKPKQETIQPQLIKDRGLTRPAKSSKMA